MTPETAYRNLTPEVIAGVATALACLDALQADYYTTQLEHEVRGKLPHSDSDAFESAKSGLLAFTLNTLPGNAQGLSMNLSSFINGLKLLGWNEAVSVALAACDNFNQTHE